MFSCNLAASIVLSTNVGCQIKLQISYIANLTTCKTFCPVVFLIRPHAPTIAANSRWTLDAKQSCAFFHGLNRINLWNSGSCIFCCIPAHPRARQIHNIFWISSKVTHFSHVGEHDQAHLVAPPVFSVATSHSCSGGKFNRFQIPSKVAHFARREFNDLSNLFVLQCFCAPVVANSRWGVPKRSCAFLASQIPRPRTSCKLFCLSCNFPTFTTLVPKKNHKPSKDAWVQRNNGHFVSRPNSAESWQRLHVHEVLTNNSKTQRYARGLWCEKCQTFLVCKIRCALGHDCGCAGFKKTKAQKRSAKSWVSRYEESATSCHNQNLTKVYYECALLSLNQKTKMHQALCENVR